MPFLLENPKDDDFYYGSAAGFGTRAARFTKVFSGETPATENLFTVDGAVLIRMFAVCGIALAVTDAPTIEVGVPGATATIIALTTAADLDAGEIWFAAAPATTEDTISNAIREFIIAGSANIQLKITTATSINSGSISFTLFYIPLTDDASVTPVA